MRSHTDVGQEHLTCNFPSSLSQKLSGFEVGALSGPVTFSHTKLIQPDAGPKGPVSNTRNTTPAILNSIIKKCGYVDVCVQHKEVV